MFNSDYYIGFSDASYLEGIRMEISDSNNINQFFKKKEIKIENSEIQELKSVSLKIGHIINLKFNSSNQTTNTKSNQTSSSINSKSLVTQREPSNVKKTYDFNKNAINYILMQNAQKAACF